MHDRCVKVFDETIQDTFVGIAGHSYRAVTWSSIEHSDFLVRADQLVVQAVVSVMVGVRASPPDDHVAAQWRRANVAQQMGRDRRSFF